MNEITSFFPFIRSLLSCLPADVLGFLMACLGVLIVAIFVKLIINFL